MGCAPCEERQATLLAWANSHTGLLALAAIGLVVVVWGPQLTHLIHT